MNIRKNMTLVVGGGICAGLLIVALVFVYLYGAGYIQGKKKLDRQYRRLAELHAEKPFPSSEHVEQSVAKMEELEKGVERFRALLAGAPFPGRGAAVDFSARVQKSIKRFRGKAQEAGVEIPQDLEAGFAQYASGGEIPARAHVARLARQLYSVESVAGILVEGGAASITGVEREHFEAAPAVDGDNEPPPRTRRGRRGMQPVEKDVTSEEKKQNASYEHPDDLYVYERVSVNFTAREEAVWKILDLFALSSRFMVVHEVMLDTQTKILSYNPVVTPTGKSSGGNKEPDAQMEKLASSVLSGSKLSRRERQIAGGEMIRVSMKVDVYNFNYNGNGGRKRE